MAWIKTKPANDTKLRLSPSLITENWAAIENGDVPNVKLQLAKQAGNPTQIADSGFVFTKKPSQTELYYADDTATPVITQITNNGGIGATTQRIYTSGITFSGSYQNVSDSFVSAWARCTGTASGFLGTAFHIASCTRTATGEYTIATDATFSDGDVAVIGTSRQLSSDTPGTFNWLVKSFAAGVVTVTVEIKNRSGNHVDRAFDIMILGGR
jgi:hypothetical protein